jgi:glutamyl-tRNA reductase
MPSPLAPLRVITVSHRTVGLGALPSYSLGCDQAAMLHAALTSGGTSSLVLATCNRSELYWHSRGAAHDGDVRAMLSLALNRPAADVVPAALSGRIAAAHLMRVASGVESVVVGEAEILGQVRAALDACPGAGAFLTGVVRAAIRAGRMARAETSVAVGAQSVTSAAVRLLAGAVDLPAARVAVVGAGETGSRAARRLGALGAREIVVLNRTPQRAAAVDVEGAESGGLDRLPDVLVGADAVLFAVAVTTPLVTAEQLNAAADRRRGRPLTLIDLSMPPAVAPGDAAGVKRFDLGTVERVVADDQVRRTAALPGVEAVIARELAILERAMARRAAWTLRGVPGRMSAEAAR